MLNEISDMIDDIRLGNACEEDTIYSNSASILKIGDLLLKLNNRIEKLEKQIRLLSKKPKPSNELVDRDIQVSTKFG